MKRVLSALYSKYVNLCVYETNVDDGSIKLINEKNLFSGRFVVAGFKKLETKVKIKYDKMR